MWLIVAATTGMGGMLILWWAALIYGLLGLQPWTVALNFNYFHEQWVEGVIFHLLGMVVVAEWVRVFRSKPTLTFSGYTHIEFPIKSKPKTSHHEKPPI